MHQISSSTTLPLRIFLPILFTTFFGLFTIAVFVSDIGSLWGIPLKAVRILLPGLFFLAIIGLYRTVWQLFRIDIDAEYLYVSNFFTTARYPIQQIDRVETPKAGGLRRGTIHLIAPGRWGQRLRFIPSRQRLRKYLQENPQAASLFQ